MILQYLFVLTLFCDVTKTQERNSDVISGVVDAIPESLQALLHSDDVSTDFDDDETREYIRSLKDVFRFANLGNTPISEVFEAGGFPFELGEIGQLSVDDVIQIMVNNMKNTLMMLHNDAFLHGNRLIFVTCCALLGVAALLVAMLIAFTKDDVSVMQQRLAVDEEQITPLR